MNIKITNKIEEKKIMMHNTNTHTHSRIANNILIETNHLEWVLSNDLW